jgi:hypothetical protein
MTSNITPFKSMPANIHDLSGLKSITCRLLHLIWPPLPVFYEIKM